MKCIIELTEAEEQTLHQLSLNHCYRDARLRAVGILQLGGQIKPNAVAIRLGVSSQSVYNWAHAWRQKGLCGLLVGHQGGRPRALSDAMMSTAVEGARAELMTLKQIGQRIEQVHGQRLPCRLDTLAAALKRAGFSYKRGRYALKKNGTNRPLL